MKTLTIAQLLPSLHSGGVEKGTLEVASAIVAAGHQSIVISAGGQLVKTLQQEGSKHVQWDLGKKSPSTLLQAKKLRYWLQDHSIDILHARSRMPAWVAYLAWKKMPVTQRPRFITTVHGLNSVSRYSKVMTAGEEVIAVSSTVKDYILEHYPDVPESKITVIHRGIDPHEFPFGYQPSEEWKQQWYARYPQTRNKWLITLPGRLTRLKGHHDFIDILQQLKQHIPGVHGLIVGEEDTRRRAYAKGLYQQVKNAGLQEFVTFTGYRPDMKEIYALSQVVLSLSGKPESFGRTTVEAISLGKAVIAYDHGGVGETLATLYPQGCVPLNDTHRIVQRCLALYTGEIQPPPYPQTTYLKAAMLEKTLDLYIA